jgi:DNA-binding transcriptional LysR family regulator
MDKSPLSWEDTQTFLAVIEHSSFSAAARSLGVGQPTISRRIKNLEQALSEQLFIRGKYGAEPTDSARHLKPAAEQMAKWAAEFGRLALSGENEVSGLVKIAAPPGAAVEQLAPFASILKLKESGIRLEVLSSVDQVDLTRGFADIAIRTQPPNEPELFCLHEVIVEQGIYAAKQYAAKLQQPCSWADLDWITWSGQYRHVPPRPMLEKIIPDFTPVFSSDDYLVQKAAVAAGVGAMILGKPMGFEQSELVQIDIGIDLPARKFYIVCAKSMRQVPRVNVVAKHLVGALHS